MELWKKILTTVVACLLCLCCVGLSELQNVLTAVETALPVCAEEYTEDRVPVSTGTTTVRVGTGTTELTYGIYEDDTVEIMDCGEDAAGDLEIPAKIDGKEVTGIQDFAFCYCQYLTGVSIPDGITNIGGCAFFACSSLTSIVIPEGVTSINIRTFGYCSSLRSVVLPNGVTSIETNSFEECISLTEIVIPDTVTYIAPGVFSSTPWLEAKQKENPLVVVNGILIDGTACSGDVLIPDGVTSIGGDAFYNCISITSVRIPDSVTKIKVGAFAACTALENIEIPDTVAIIEEAAFRGTAWQDNKMRENPLLVVNHILLVADEERCSGKVVIPDGVTRIGDGALSGCEKMTEVVIPDSVSYIGYSAFAGCLTLKEVSIPDGVTEIMGGTFHSCFKLTRVSIPVSVTAVGVSAFYDDLSIKDVYYSGTRKQWNAIAFSDRGQGNDLAKATIHFSDGVLYVPTLVGDINLDGRVDIIDAVLLNKFCSDSVTLNDNAIANADCDGDGDITGNDAVIMMRFLVHLIDHMPYTE